MNGTLTWDGLTRQAAQARLADEDAESVRRKTRPVEQAPTALPRNRREAEELASRRIAALEGRGVKRLADGIVAVKVSAPGDMLPPEVRAAQAHIDDPARALRKAWSDHIRARCLEAAARIIEERGR